ncbi:MAG: carboxypeptidase-like regulatory domain-containing protein [Haliscomenobacter sp.]|uniref:carboxypeptidase-like regulatory domain-containing protein n=1 Tax=Haliscomenobacter sp. TaxID=2717303 RepID=UPI0029ACD9E5|nr:alpha-2-macroglobulin family protein [Haliscomenobacter sp.]MDX2072433.1 carboxypeptidase-like regulatory domain-containing protein [Haliscomenobacter sp.]
MKPLRTLSLFIALLGCTLNLPGQQNLLQFFRLEPTEAAQLYQNPKKQPDSTFFHTPITKIEAEQEIGHYLQVHIRGEFVDIALKSTAPIQVQALNNHQDLSILVKDSLGRQLPDVQVLLGKKQLRYDPETQSFRIKYSPKERILEIKSPAFSAYYTLVRNGKKSVVILTHYRRFSTSRVGRFVTLPIKVVQAPIAYVVRSIRSHRWVLPWKYWFSQKYNRDLEGYIALSQPVYRPGDTLKMKAYVTTTKGRPLHKGIDLQLSKDWSKQVFTKKIKPERPGVYLFEWPLADTLEIDEEYQLKLSKRRSDIKQGFRLEEYELDEINYTLKVFPESFTRGEKCTLSLSAKTTNDLAVPDATAEIFILAGTIQTFHDQAVVVPDTLWHSNENLGVRGEWDVNLPDSLLPAASMSLRCHVYFNSSSGQLSFKDKTLQFKYEPSFKLSLDGNKIIASTTSALSDSLVLLAQYPDEKSLTQKVLLPAQLPLDPNVESYTLLNPKTLAEFKLPLYPEKEGLLIMGERSADSVHLRIENPRNLPLWYQIKTRSGTIETGFIRDSLWLWQHQDQSSNFYHLYYQYLWAGEIHEERQEFRHYPKALSIEMEGPDLVIPGQENSYKVQVKHGSGRPAKGVDLSAGAINAQFGDETSYSTPNIGYRRQPVPRTFPSFRLYDSDRNYKLPMTRFLTQTFQLQEVLYYQYRYTSQLLLTRRDSALRQDSFYQNIAQFAPFVVKGGKMQPIFLIYLNRKLVYSHLTQDPHPYSFLGTEGYHQITIRTREYEYVLDSIFLRRGEKLELVLNEDFWPNGSAPAHFKRIPVAQSFSSVEKGLLRNSIFVIQNLKAKDSVFVWDDPQNIHFITDPSGQNNYVGPFNAGTNLTYLSMNQFKSSFVFEPGFSYAVEKKRERLYQHELFPANKKEALLPRSLPHPAIGQNVISPKSVRAFSPVKRSIVFDQTPAKQERGAGKYQFFYPTFKTSADSLNLSFLIIRNLKADSQLVLNPNTRFIPNLPAGTYELLLFNRKEAAFRKNIQIRRDTLLYEDLSKIQFQQIDSLLPSLLGEKYIPIQPVPSTSMRTGNYYGQTQLLKGRILDSNGEPLIGASVLVKGTSVGTVTDFDGTYSVFAPLGYQTIVVSYTGYRTQELLVNDRNYASQDILLNESLSMLSEVVVTGYGVAATRTQEASVSLAGKVPGVAVRGARTSTEGYYVDGVRSRGFASLDGEEQGSDTLSFSGIRKSFHDHAFWQPRLRSNRSGEAQFKVKFPDDITNWKVFVLGADKNRRAGLYTGSIQSYKPLMAQLSLPRFLLHGDQTTLSGKVLNYTQDSFQLKTYFQAAEQRLAEKQGLVKEAMVEKTEFKVPDSGDSLTFRFALETPQGYTDGEERQIPVFPIGTLETDGHFMIIERDTLLDFRDKNGQIQFRAQPSALHLLQEDFQYLQDYPYTCNEQTASKLIGLLSEKQVCQALNKPFTGEKTIRSAVTRLVKAQNADGSWGWWANGAANIWMSNYVTRALHSAQTMGYPSKALENGLRWLTNQFPLKNDQEFLQTLETLLQTGQKITVSKELSDSLNKPQKLLYNRLLKLWVQQELGLKPSLDSLLKYRKLDVYGGAFWEESETNQDWQYDWYNNRLSNTLLAYQIAQKAGLKDELRRIRIHLMANRGYTQNGLRSAYGWRNTLEVAAVLKTILPDLLLEKSAQLGKLQLSGALSGEVSTSALQTTFDASQPLTLKLNGAGPFFCTAYQQTWNANPQPKSDLFAVKSHLEQNGAEIKQLQFGKPAQLVVEIEVKKEAQYAMIEIPIPAGCSYFKKPQSYRSPEVHREYFAEKVSIFCERLPIGKQRFVVDLEPRFSGTYTLNPVRVEEMYFPVLYGRNGVEKVLIRT